MKNVRGTGRITPGVGGWRVTSADHEMLAFTAPPSSRLVKTVVDPTTTTVFDRTSAIIGSALKFSTIIIVGFSKVCQEDRVILSRSTGQGGQFRSGTSSCSQRSYAIQDWSAQPNEGKRARSAVRCSKWGGGEKSASTACFSIVLWRMLSQYTPGT